jgi:Na+-driven multidrug efflux pump
LSIIGGGMILQFIGMGFNNFIRTAGDPKRALYTMIAGTAACIALNFLFVMVLGWGIAGSAWATVLGQALSAVLVLWYFVLSDKAPFKLRLRYCGLRLRFVKGILALGAAPFVLQVSNAFINFLLNNQLNLLGADHIIGSDGALAAIGVVFRIGMFSFFPALGVAFAAQPLLGYNYGAANYVRVKAIFRIAAIWMISLGALFWILIQVIPGPIVLLFGITDDLRVFAVGALRVELFLLPIIGFQVLVAQYFQSSGQPLKAMILSLTRPVFYLVPLLYLLPLVITSILPTLTPLDGLYYSYPVADALSITTCAVFMGFELRKLNRQIREQAGG